MAHIAGQTPHAYNVAEQSRTVFYELESKDLPKSVLQEFVLEILRNSNRENGHKLLKPREF